MSGDSMVGVFFHPQETYDDTGKSPIFYGKTTNFIGQSPFFMGKSALFLGDTSSNGLFFHCHVTVFGGVTELDGRLFDEGLLGLYR